MPQISVAPIPSAPSGKPFAVERGPGGRAGDQARSARPALTFRRGRGDLGRALGLCGAFAVLAGPGSAAGSEAGPAYAEHLAARLEGALDLPAPQGQRPPFGWSIAPVRPADQPPLVLTWEDSPKAADATRLRIAVGLDERDEKTVEAVLSRSGRVVGVFDLRYVSQFQVYEIPLAEGDAAGIVEEGVALRLTKGSELEILVGGEEAPSALLPHLLLPGTAEPMEEFHRRLDSFAVVQQFGWMEGCVLDGLLDLSALPGRAGLGATALRHLGLFFRDGGLVYESPRSAPSDGRIYGIEGGLPFAALARVRPDDPMLDLALRFWESRRRPTGAIQDGGHMSSEGAYTVAYPMALLARHRGDERLMQDALYQCRLRQARFFDGREVWRTYDDDGKRGNRNWARGIAWQMLGLARTLEVARERSDIGDLVLHQQRLADWILEFQRDDGLWSVIVDEAGLVPDTAGSAGIAAALAISARNGWLGESARLAAERTLAGLGRHLTPDGFLGGVSQSNKGGLGLQRSEYRAIFQMGMGLMAQLEAALEQPAAAEGE